MPPISLNHPGYSSRPRRLPAFMPIPYRCTCDYDKNLENLYYAQSNNDKWKEADMPTNGIGKRQDKEKSIHH